MIQGPDHLMSWPSNILAVQCPRLGARHLEHSRISSPSSSPGLGQHCNSLTTSPEKHAPKPLLHPYSSKPSTPMDPQGLPPLRSRLIPHQVYIIPRLSTPLYPWGGLRISHVPHGVKTLSSSSSSSPSSPSTTTSPTHQTPLPPMDMDAGRTWKGPWPRGWPSITRGAYGKHASCLVVCLFVLGVRGHPRLSHPPRQPKTDTTTYITSHGNRKRGEGNEKRAPPPSPWPRNAKPKPPGRRRSRFHAENSTELSAPRVSVPLLNVKPGKGGGSGGERAGGGFSKHPEACEIAEVRGEECILLRTVQYTVLAQDSATTYTPTRD
ncbi:hypothetical protein BJ875DRAFT_269509 [Amylocarpus encephaloides]|uniref:Uncharacterized protein n=1 Tax=Amylocarpus encephaloides TaxID=45428 RepID=A0A9P7YL61_9HELO|nr:hypothetical protein BJ875DRAFT_269509 [Amylocarpus encephaloides]